MGKLSEVSPIAKAAFLIGMHSGDEFPYLALSFEKYFPSSWKCCIPQQTAPKIEEIWLQPSCW